MADKRGRDGRDGRPGRDGRDGKSSYELALANGFEGSEEVWIRHVIARVAIGDRAALYQAATANGFTGSWEKLYEILRGPAGADGKHGIHGKDGQDGKDGRDGKDGKDGKSAYEIAVAHGFDGTESEWLKSLKGERGREGPKGEKGERGERGPQGPAGPGASSGFGGGPIRIRATDVRMNDGRTVETAVMEGGGGGGGAVASVNGQTGAVILGAADVGADASGAAAAAQAAAEAYADALTAADVGADPAGSAAAAEAASDPVGSAAAAQAAAQTYADGKVLDSIADSDTTHAPSRNAVHDALLGKANLVGGVIPSSEIPAIAITEYLGTVANQAAMLALVGQKGDWAIRSDLGTVFVITGNDPTQIADWTALSYPTAPVTSVNGETGAVTLSPADIGSPAGSGTSTGTNTGDQTSIVGITGTLAQFNTALTGADFATGGGTVTGASSGTNTGDQTTIAGITGTKAEFDAAVTDDNFAFTSAANSFTQGQTITPAVNASALTVANQTHTASAPALNTAQTWNNGAATFIGRLHNITNTASAGASVLDEVQLAGVTRYNLTTGGLGTFLAGVRGGVSGAFIFQMQGDIDVRSSAQLNWSNSATDSNQTKDTSIGRAGAANSLVFGAGDAAAGAVTSRTCMNKAVATIANATATDVFTVTIPNAAHTASIRVKLVGVLGAGGAVGAGEAAGTIEYDIIVTRVAGVNAVAAISAAFGSQVTAVAGATTVTVAGTLGAVAGAVGASNTFTIKVTITRGGGSSANHTCLAFAELMNANATGVTIA